MKKKNGNITDTFNDDNRGTADANKNYRVEDFLINSYLMREKTKEIKVLEATKQLLIEQKVHSKKPKYQVQIWAEDLTQMINKPYHGSISKVITDAEAEFKKINNLADTYSVSRLTGTFDVYLWAGKEKLHVPKQYYEQFRK